jgi:glycosyltransferase involved in cell wall biosynthesis
MFRNMLPWDAAERREYGFSRMRLKLELLRRAQAATFRRADGVIFLTEHAQTRLLREVTLRGSHAVIPHGLDQAFFARPSTPVGHFSDARPFRWLYVSAIHRYKHPWNVAEAVAMLRASGLPASLQIVGPSYPPALARLEATVTRLDPGGGFLRVLSARKHSDLPGLYRQADGFVFASTCENLPNSLLEAMAAALPIVCSDRAPMPEILGDGGLYANPQDPAALANSMRQLMSDDRLRTRLADKAQVRARAFSWTRCARDTFDFLAQVGRSSHAMRHATPSVQS